MWVSFSDIISGNDLSFFVYPAVGVVPFTLLSLG